MFQTDYFGSRSLEGTLPNYPNRNTIYKKEHIFTRKKNISFSNTNDFPTTIIFKRIGHKYN